MPAPDNTRADHPRLHSAFDRMPMSMRLTLLVSSIIETNRKSATTPITALITCAACMARQLSASQREQIAEHLRREAEWVEATMQ